jgi:integrase
VQKENTVAVEERNGRYRGVYRLPGSRTKQFTDTYASYHEAHDAVLEAKRTAPTEPAVVAFTSRGATVAEHAHDWLRRRTCGSTTLKWYRQQVVCGIDAYPLLADVLLETIDYRTVESWRVAQMTNGDGKPVMNARLKVLRMVMQDAIRAKLLTDDPTEGTKRFKHQPREGRYFTDAEVDAVLDVAGEDRTMRLLVLACVDAGLRWEEASALCVDAVGPSFLTVKRSTDRQGNLKDDTKNHKDRKVPISERLAVELAWAVKPAKLARGPQGLLLCRDDGRALDYFHHHRELLLPAFTTAGITGTGLGWHDLRHTFGSRCAERGVPTSVIQRWMGHSDPKITDRYLHAGTAVTELDMLRRAMG